MRQPDGSVPTGWYLLPLRLFLGVTFFFAGLQKLSDPQFLKTSSPTGIHAQLLATVHSSPIHLLTSHLLPHSTAVGLAIAIGEVSIGAGVLAGLWTRVAAAAGMALSFGLFLTVSFHASPYYTGSDIVFLFAWTPLLLAGAAGAPAVDTWLADRQQPVRGAPASVSRRAVLSKGALTGLAAGVVVVLGGLTAAIGRLAGGTTDATAQPAGTLSGSGSGSGSGSSTTSTTAGPGATTAPAKPSGTAIGPASSVPLGGSASFTDPKSGDPSLVIQQTAGAFAAFDAVCPHQGCTVAYQSSARLIACPCHGSTFNPRTGAVENGPAPNGLTKIAVVQGADGNLYVPK
ncbi:MAG TPA: Rieske 2Fe-2S domain-containing protein [Acidimicrobiales bacterium]|nr:Rieske 2Fe-2S domain-containing protein [Acidimicrobiales bacterium]